VVALIVRIVQWNLNGTPTSIPELRRYLRDESVDAFSEVPGLRFKVWIADEATNRWGAVYLWESREAAAGPLPSRAAQMIGKVPDCAEWWEVEATVEGRFGDPRLARLGRAFEDVVT